MSQLSNIFSSETQFAPIPSDESQRVIAYEDSGPVEDTTKPVFVLAPGLGDIRQTYRFVAPLIHQDGYRVLVMDLRGLGQSSATFTSYLPEDTANDILVVLNHAKVTSTVVLVGNSFAGAAACIIAAKHPEKVHAIVLSCPFLRDMPADKYVRPILGMLLNRLFGAAFWMWYWRTLFTDPARKPTDFENVANALKENLKEPGRIQAVRALASSSKKETWELVRQVSQPVLLIFGSKDPDFSNTEQEIEAVRPQFCNSAKFEAKLMDGLGHYPHAEGPQEFHTLIKEFLSQ